MTHFIARFPQHIRPISNPNPEDYLEASEWHRSRGNYWLADDFYYTYRKLKLIREMTPRPIEAERAG
jgi:hypothetical protein